MVDRLFGQQLFGFVHFYSALPVKSISCVDCSEEGYFALGSIESEMFLCSIIAGSIECCRFWAGCYNDLSQSE
jgi:hypothetical protein